MLRHLYDTRKECLPWISTGFQHVLVSPGNKGLDSGVDNRHNLTAYRQGLTTLLFSFKLERGNHYLVLEILNHHAVNLIS